MSQDTYELSQGFTHGVDASLLRQQLELSMADRLRQLDKQIKQMRLLMAAGERARGRNP
jgi:hypothetical protein